MTRTVLRTFGIDTATGDTWHITGPLDIPPDAVTRTEIVDLPPGDVHALRRAGVPTAKPTGFLRRPGHDYEPGATILYAKPVRPDGAK